MPWGSSKLEKPASQPQTYLAQRLWSLVSCWCTRCSSTFQAPKEVSESTSLKVCAMGLAGLSPDCCFEYGSTPRRKNENARMKTHSAQALNLGFLHSKLEAGQTAFCREASGNPVKVSVIAALAF